MREKIFLAVVFLIALAIFVDLNTPLVSLMWENYTGLTDRLAIHQDFKIGYINRRGRIMIPPKFDQGTSHFPSGPAPVMEGKKWGYIDISGEYMIKPQFRIARTFSEGLAAVAPAGRVLSLHGFIDKDGAYVVGPKYRDTRDFHEGKAAVQLGDDWAYIDREGTYFVPPSLEEAGDFSEGFAPAREGAKWGYLGMFGTWQIDPRFDGAQSFSEGLAPVKKNGLWGYINPEGFLVIEHQYNDAQPFSDGLAGVTMGQNTIYIDRRNRRVIESTDFLESAPFSEGLARVKVRTGRPGPETGKWGYIDKQGEVVIEPRFDWAWDFGAGVARVGLGKNSIKRGYIDTEGAFIWNPAQWDKQYYLNNVLRNIGLVFGLLLIVTLLPVYSRKRKQVALMTAVAFKKNGTFSGGLFRDLRVVFPFDGKEFRMFLDHGKSEYDLMAPVVETDYPKERYHYIVLYPKSLQNPYLDKELVRMAPYSENPVLRDYFSLESEEDEAVLDRLFSLEMVKKIVALRTLNATIKVSAMQGVYGMRADTDVGRAEDFENFVDCALDFYLRLRELDQKEEDDVFKEDVS